ncbi:receptor-type tyrosine-protein phosphatase H isoform X2 [Mustela putorius furo]|uniref:Receptor-type tyrosine-protein phosphatase H n=1 Tax=Mustela putorius furo TaxID=9669 RepID=A0A8U0S1F3_MUSPF|nr:receptor-type tyrosine-protein phosphatase H isoform X2 [Mustela putorius furo]
MKRTRGSLEAWGSLVLLALCSWTGSWATVPKPVRNLSVKDQTNSSITLGWTEPDGTASQHYLYRIQWEGTGTPGNKSTDNTSVLVDGLQPGSWYQFAVWVELNGTRSSQETCNVSTAPNRVMDLHKEAQTNSSITLGWTEPDGTASQHYLYRIQWEGTGTPGNKSTDNTSVLVDGLQPGSWYQFAVWVELNGTRSSQETCNVSTVPNVVTSLRIQNRTNSSLTLSWTAPVGPDHPSYTYWVSWVIEGTMVINTQDTRVSNTSDTRITLEQLEAGSLYTFTVQAERNGVSSDIRTLTEATAPNRVMDLHKEAQTNSSITLRWKSPTDPHSQAYTYWVQWAAGEHPQGDHDPRGHQANQTRETNHTYYEVQALEPGTLYNFSVWAERSNVASSAQGLLESTAPSPVTITSCISISGGHGVVLNWSCPRGGYEAFELQVGGQQDSQNRLSCEKRVSVWGLWPAQSYPAIITTIWDGMRAPSASVTCRTENSGAIVGAIVGVTLFLIPVGLLIFFLKKRHEKSQREPAPRGLVFSFSEDILAEDFADHVRKNEKDSNFGFEEEYQQLALETYSQSQTVALAPENSAKNRYRNVLPYDWSRVPLKAIQEEPGSDYINASFMPGLENPQEFIATQGPLPQTVGDFWRLVWEQQSRTLVMLTNCVESGQVKCEHYWPLDAKPCTHGHLQVTLEGEEVLEDWTVRDLTLQHMQEQKTLPVRQFHYMTWPDHGVPHSTDPMLAFRKVLRQWLDQTTEGGPPIVHCSAGVGRTGTLIALDILLRQLDRDQRVGPFSYVQKMRESRPLMVQTEAQYVFLHHCILRFLQQSSRVPTDNGVAYENPLYENV